MGRMFTGGAPQRLPALRGRFYYRRWKGKTIVCAWPRKKPAKLSPAQQRAVNAFSEAAELIKRTDPSMVEVARHYSAGTQALWRDLFYQAMYGRFPFIFVVDGKRIRPLAARNDVSTLLDALGDAPGNLLFRDDTYWDILPPGAPNQVLVMDPATGVPKWSSVPTGATAPATLLQLTGNGPASTSWPKIASFDAAMYDDLSIWNPAQPTRLTVPPGATRVRLSAQVEITAGTGCPGFFASFINSAGTTGFTGNSRSNSRFETGGFNNNIANIQTAWLPAADADWYELRVNLNSAYNGGFLSTTWAMMEAQ